ncbi:hypothetical protein HWV62_6831 [Athelia sp. TMB]|nr:hypothetical protein HWV62_6831 [Athelia sp. TMB]
MDHFPEDLDDLHGLPSYATAAFEQYPPRLESKQAALGLARHRPGGPRPALPIPPAPHPSPVRKLPSRAPSPALSPPPPARSPPPAPPALPHAHSYLPRLRARSPTPATHPNEKHLREIALDSSFLAELDEQLLLAPLDAFLEACWAEVLSDDEPAPALALSARAASPLRMSYLRGLMADDDPVYEYAYDDSLDPFSLEEGEVQWAPAAELVGDAEDDDDVSARVLIDLRSPLTSTPAQASGSRTPTQKMPSTPSTAYSWCPMPDDVRTPQTHIISDPRLLTPLSQFSETSSIRSFASDSTAQIMSVQRRWRPYDADSLAEFSRPTTDDIGSEPSPSPSPRQRPPRLHWPPPHRYDASSPPSRYDTSPPSPPSRYSPSPPHNYATPPSSPPASRSPSPPPLDPHTPLDPPRTQYPYPYSTHAPSSATLAAAPVRLQWCPPPSHSHGAQLLAYWEPHFAARAAAADGVAAFPARPPPRRRAKSTGSGARWKIFGARPLGSL